MKHGQAFKIFTCFVCFSFLLFAGGIASLHAEGKKGAPPVGEMISRGIVKYQVGENLWKRVEASSFPIFQGMTIKTEKGTAIVSLSDKNQIELGPDSVLYFEEKEQIRLSKGSLNFRISPSRVMRLCAGNFMVVGTSALHASKGLASVSKAEEATGSLSIHSNSAVTIQGIQGHLTLLNQERTVMATIAPKESLTLPAAAGAKSGKEKTPAVQMAQVGEEEETAAGKGKGKETAS
ncbi:MAG: hypothetical protein H6Q42_4754, partial [Deltaproteobacteria bacterium]|nr:hypothetical protein [Deltaproteobacteria bacterium]